MFTAVTPTIDAAIEKLGLLQSGVFSASFFQPNLGGYSQIPSLQLIATEHGLAISGSSGSATAVEISMGKQLRWAHSNLSDFRKVIADHESTMSRVFRNINPFNGGKTSLSEAAHASGVFQRRPMFDAGTLAFTPVTVTAELGMDTQSLLAEFSATNDAAIADAIAYWAKFSSSMSTLASDLAAVSTSLVSSNTGEVFIAANATMKSLAARATSIATASEVIKGHLEVLPGVRAMAINALSAIQAESKALTNPVAQKTFEQAEVVAFLTGPYTAQLQTAIPRIPNLVSADIGSGVTTAVTAGATITGRSGTNQMGLSPAGMHGSVHASTTPAGAASTIPGSPSQMATSTTPASAVPATQSALPTGPQPMASGSSGTSTMPSGAAGGLPSPIQPQASMPRSAVTGPAAASSRASLPIGSQPMHARPAGSTHAATMPQLKAANSAVFNNASPRNQTGLPQTTAFSPGAAARSMNSRSVGGAGLIGGAPGMSGMSGGAGGAGSAAVGNASQRSNGLMHALTNARSGAGGTAAGAHGHGAHGAATVAGGRGRGAVEASARRLTNVTTIRDNDAGAFEQNEYQRELFGDAPATIPAVIGHNVRS